MSNKLKLSLAQTVELRSLLSSQVKTLRYWHFNRDEWSDLEKKLRRNKRRRLENLVAQLDIIYDYYKSQADLKVRKTWEDSQKKCKNSHLIPKWIKVRCKLEKEKELNKK